MPFGASLLMSCGKLTRHARKRNTVRKNISLRGIAFRRGEDAGGIRSAVEAIAAGHPAAKIDELMLWNFGKAT